MGCVAGCVGDVIYGWKRIGESLDSQSDVLNSIARFEHMYE